MRGLNSPAEAVNSVRVAQKNAGAPHSFASWADQDFRDARASFAFWYPRDFLVSGWDRTRFSMSISGCT
jgi:hypothetical protein